MHVSKIFHQKLLILSRIKDDRSGLHGDPMSTLLHPKYIKHGWVGYTFTKVLMFLFLYYSILIFVSIFKPSYEYCMNDVWNDQSKSR